MKKLFIAVLSMATLASCFQSEFAVEQAIDFNTYVGSTTKSIDPSIDNDNITNYSFYVWGTTQETGGPIVPIFENVPVGYDGSAWKYAPQYTQYWFSGNKYHFAAVVNGNVTALDKGLPKTISYTAGTDKDLLYARTKPEGITHESNGKTVAFIFDHLLSKAVFTFENTTEKTTGAPANIYKVTNIEISGLPASANYDVAAGAWKDNTGSTLIENFGNIVLSTESDKNNTEAIDVKEEESGKSLYEHLLIPGTHNVTITCSIVLYNGVADAAHVVKTISYSQPHTITLEKGKAYNFVLSAGLTETIDFKVNTVNTWLDGGNL